MSINLFFQAHRFKWSFAPRTEVSHAVASGTEFTALCRGTAIALGCTREWKHIFARPDKPHSLQRRILNYLVEHRLAKDTVEGVVQWWIADRAQPPATLDVQHALDELVGKGWVVVTKRSPNSTLYGLEESCMNEIQEFLKA